MNVSRRLSERLHRWVPVVSIALILGVIAGCGGVTSQAPIVGEENIKKASRLYFRFVADHQGRGPKDQQEWESYLKGLDKSVLDELGITDVDKALTSPRDNQKYGIVFGLNMRSLGAGGGMVTRGKEDQETPLKVVVYEKVGSGGKRYVAYALGGGIEEVDEETFNKLVPNP